MNAWLLILSGIVWLTGIAIVAMMQVGFGVAAPKWVPMRLLAGVMSSLIFVLYLGWLVPLSVGIWKLFRQR